MGIFDMTVRNLTKLFALEVLMGLFPGLAIKLLGTEDTQLSVDEKRMDILLLARIAGVKYYVNLEFQWIWKGATVVRLYDYAIGVLKEDPVSQRKAGSKAGKGLARTPVLSVLVPMTGAKTVAPGYHGVCISGKFVQGAKTDQGTSKKNANAMAPVEFPVWVNPLSQMTTEELLALPSVWSAFVGLASDASLQNIAKAMDKLTELIRMEKRRWRQDLLWNIATAMQVFAIGAGFSKKELDPIFKPVEVEMTRGCLLVDAMNKARKEGKREGIKEGKEEGIKEGKKEGRDEGLNEGRRVLLEAVRGFLPPEVYQKLSIADLGDLKAAILAAQENG